MLPSQRASLNMTTSAEKGQFLASVFEGLRSAMEIQLRGAHENIFQEMMKSETGVESFINSLGMDRMKMQREMGVLQERNAFLEAEIKGLENRDGIARQEVSKYKDMAQGLQRQKTSLESKAGDLGKQNSSLQAKMEELQERIISLQTQVEDGKGTEKELRKTVADLHKEVEIGKQRQIELENRIREIHTINSQIQKICNGGVGIGTKRNFLGLEYNLNGENVVNGEGSQAHSQSSGTGSMNTEKNFEASPSPPNDQNKNKEKKTSNKNEKAPVPSSSSSKRDSANSGRSLDILEGSRNRSKRQQREDDTTSTKKSKMASGGLAAENANESDDEVEVLSHQKPSGTFLISKQILDEYLKSSSTGKKVFEELRSGPQADGIISDLITLILSEVRLTAAICQIKLPRFKLLVSLARCIFQNPNFNLDLKARADDLIKAILKMILEPSVASHPVWGSHWDFRDLAGALLAELTQKFRSSQLGDIISNLSVVLRDSNASFESIYGAIVGLGAMGDEVVQYEILLPIQKIGRLVEDRKNSSGTSLSKEADGLSPFDKVRVAILNLIGPLVVSSSMAPVGLAEFKRDFGCFGEVLFDYCKTHSDRIANNTNGQT